MNHNQTTPEHIAISKSKAIRIDWKDGHHSEFDLAYLRDRCPCATCTGVHGTTPQKSNYSAQTSPFQMFEPKLRIDSVEPAGNYALQINWSDGHNSGIYTWEYLRSISPEPTAAGS